MPTKARRGDALPKTPPSGGRTLSFYPVPLIYKVGCRKRHGPAIEEDEPRGDARLGARGGTAPGRRRLLEVGILGIRGSVFSFRRIFSSLGVPDLVSEFAGVAEQIQRALLDVGIPSLPGLDVGIRAAPARLVGGDYLDIITRPGRAPLFAIGDVSGKSLPAAMRAVMLKYLVRGLTVALTDDLALILRQANEAMCDELEEDAFVTFLIATFEHENRLLRWANAGHDPPLAYRASQGKIEHLPPSGLVLGVERGTRYRVQTTMLEPEDAIVFYTDGFTDARSPGGEQFTLARIEEGLMEMRALTAQAMAEALFERVEAHAAGTLADDASIMVVRVTQ
jgi:sigma-B regulation protein RsbU (phosphoserine phosphatase)